MTKSKGLINPYLIESAANSLSARNRLLKQLNTTSEKDKNHFSKWILAYWMGSSITYGKLVKSPAYDKSAQFIQSGHLLFLTLDRAISVLSSIKSKSNAIKILKKCQYELLNYFNCHEQMLATSQQTLLSQFQSSLQTINTTLIGDKEQQAVVEKTKKILLETMSEQLSNNAEKDAGIIAFKDEKLPIFDSQNSLGQRINRHITQSNNNLVYYRELPSDDLFDKYQLNNVLVRANDGALLDGLHIQKKGRKKDTVIFALIGHFQTENNYLSKDMINFYKLFKSDVVLINHRNYSQRSGKDAQSIDELSKDVISFTNHFKKHYDHLVLYGMCGGAAHMIHAASMLQSQNLPFKLIVDRFSTNYSNFLQPKTHMRILKYLPAHTPSKTLNYLLHSDYGFIVLIPLLWIIMMLAILLLNLSKSNINFAQLIRTIPKEDILILQAKAPKIIGQSDPDYTDYYVHPDNDIRDAIKVQRKNDKQLLNDLISKSRAISSLVEFDVNLSLIFHKLSMNIQSCIDTIDDEKLMLHKAKPKIPQDLHTEKLFQLETRSHTPIKSFIRSFFTPSKNPWKDKLTRLNQFTPMHIQQALNLMYGDKNTANYIESLSLIVHSLFSDISTHNKFIYRLDNRAAFAGNDNLNDTLDKLFASNFYSELKIVSQGVQNNAN
jgi:hypothetical protein